MTVQSTQCRTCARLRADQRADVASIRRLEVKAAELSQQRDNAADLAHANMQVDRLTVELANACKALALAESERDKAQEDDALSMDQARSLQGSLASHVTDGLMRLNRMLQASPRAG